MDCKKAQKLMSAYVDDMLETAEKSAFEAHMKDCENCRRELELLKSTVAALSDLKLAAPENFTDEVREKLKSAVPQKRRTFAHLGRFSVCAAAFVILAAVAFSNPVWEEFLTRTTQNAVQNNEKFVQNKDNAKNENPDSVISADVGEKAENEEKSSPASDEISARKNVGSGENVLNEKAKSNEKIKSNEETKSNGNKNSENINAENTKAENIGENADTTADRANEIFGADKGENAAKQTQKTAENHDLSVLSDEINAENGSNSRAGSQAEINSANENAARYANQADSAPLCASASTAESDTAPKASLKSAGGADFTAAKISINSNLDLAETAKKIGEILGCEITGENKKITLTVTADEYVKLCEKLKNNEDFDGFDTAITENYAEISIFTK